MGLSLLPAPHGSANDSKNSNKNKNINKNKKKQRQQFSTHVLIVNVWQRLHLLGGQCLVCRHLRSFLHRRSRLFLMRRPRRKLVRVSPASNNFIYRKIRRNSVATHKSTFQKKWWINWDTNAIQYRLCDVKTENTNCGNRTCCIGRPISVSIKYWSVHHKSAVWQWQSKVVQIRVHNH